MARPSLPNFDGPYPQYYSIIVRADGVTPFGQIRSADMADKVDVVKAGRVGSSTKKSLRKSKETTAKIAVWVDHANDMNEVARVLGATSTPTIGTTIKLDPTVAAQTLQIQNYNGEPSTATLLSTAYLYNFTPNELGYKLDEDGEQVAEIGGDMEDLYWVIAS